MKDDIKYPNHSHAWRGSWDRPMKIDEDSVHPFTVARMTDHNVRGNDKKTPEVSEINENERSRQPQRSFSGKRIDN